MLAHRTSKVTTGARRTKSIKIAMRSCTVEKRRNLSRRSTGFVDLTFLVRFRSHCPSNIDRKVATKPRLSDLIHVRLFALLEQDAFNKLRKDRSDLHLHVPLLSGDPGMHRHVLHRELNFDGQTPKLHNLTQAEPDGDRPDVVRRRVPVGQDITRVPEAPALAEEDRRDGLQVHLVRVLPEVLPADGPPLLGKHANEVLLR